MSESDLHLVRAPIVEAVLDIECDFAPGFDLLKLEEPGKQAFQGAYPKLSRQLIQEFKFAAKPDGPPESSTRQAVQAFRFLHDDEKQLVQVRRTGYSFNRLAPYSSFDDYLPEIRRTWDIYRGFAEPVQVLALQLRYINRIHLPLSGARVELDDYFKNGPKLPEDDGFAFVGFLNQHVAVEENTGYVMTTVLTAQQQQGDKLPVIFDNAVRADVKAEPEDWEGMRVVLLALRDLKNRVFKATLTDKCLSLFQ